MPDTLSWFIPALYITAGYMLVVACASVGVALVARSARSQAAYASLAVAALAGAGVQVASAIYYHASTLTHALTALTWQTDFTSVAILSAVLYLIVMGFGTRGLRWWAGAAVLLAIFLIALNRASPLSLHFQSIHGFTPLQGLGLQGLTAVHGQAGYGAWTWYSVFGLALLAGAAAIYQLWHSGQTHRALLGLVYLIAQAIAVAVSLGMDGGLWSYLYPSGFAVALLALLVSISTAVEAAQRSQQLRQRERQMQGEVLHRRKAEDKLQRLSQVFMQAPSPTHIVDLQGKTLQVNEESVRYLRRDVSIPPRVDFISALEHLGVKRERLLEDLNSGSMGEFGPYFFSAGVPADALYVVRDAWLKFKTYPIFDNERRLHEFVVSIEDVTEKQFVDNAIKTIALAVSAETGQAFFTQLVVDLARLLNKKYVFIGLRKIYNGVPHIETLAAATDGELTANFHFPLGNTPSDQVLTDGDYAVARKIQESFPGQKLLREKGAQSYVGAAIVDQHKEPIGVLAVMDIKPMEHIRQLREVVKIFVSRAGTELQRLEAEQTIRTMAFEDFLTGLPNRTKLNEHVVNLLQQRYSGVTSAFIQLDLDHFKTINDALGHDIGDDVIRCLGQRLRQNADENMLVARIGGDEFAIVVSDLGRDVANNLDRIALQLIALMERPVQVGEHLLDVGCTMGVVLFPDFTQTAIDVFRSADIALYKAKTAGSRGSYQMFTPEMRDAVSKRLQIEKGLRHALQNNELTLYYQPQVNSEGRLVGAEALVRWIHPEHGLIPPASFIPVAEETGLINLLGQWVLDRALNTRRSWEEQQLPFLGHMSVNVSAWQFARPDFVATTLAAIKRAQVPPSFLTLEVTETALLTDIGDTISKLTELRNCGVTIALDDFGTGYSSLAYLRDLPLDVLKVDKVFVDALEHEEREPLVESMVAIGKHMGLQVVAEGVETALQLERLKALGCQIFQGYLFAKPMPEEEFIRWLHRHNAAPQNIRRTRS